MTFDTNKILGQSPKLQEVLRAADLVSVTDVPVLITGETGTGKDLFARRIHQQSPRKQREFVTINCATLAGQHAESFLFGHKQGAFAEAGTNNPGMIAKAGSGTLFFDEISELSLSLQVKLLRFIETGEVQPLGYSSPRNYDVRIIAASNKNLAEEVEKGNFRADLYYRLNIIPLELPALREREGDIAVLMAYFFREFVRKQHLTPPGFTTAALKQINKYQWPGNVRELRNFCERLLILFSGKEIDVTNLPHEMRYFSEVPSGHPNASFNLPENGINLESVEVDLMLQALDKSSGNKSKAARLLGLSRDTFLYRLKKYSIAL
jgi:DNA-binding NtrC family response regulator